MRGRDWTRRRTGRSDRGVRVPVASITVDGQRQDWSGVPPAATDRQGDDPSRFSGADAKALCIAQDVSRATLYVMLDFWDGRPNPDLASGAVPGSGGGSSNILMGYMAFLDNSNDGRYEGELFARYLPLLQSWPHLPCVPFGGGWRRKGKPVI